LSANLRGKEGHPSTTVGIRKLESLGYHGACLRDPMSSRFETIPACDRHTDRHTHTHTHDG